MAININVDRKHLLVFLLIVAIATVINYTIAQGGGTQSHPANEVSPGSFAVGSYTFPSKLVATEMCLPSDSVENCMAAWPSSGNAFVIVVACTGPGCSGTCDTTCSAYSGCAFGEVISSGYSQGVTSCSTSLDGDDKCVCWP